MDEHASRSIAGLAAAPAVLLLLAAIYLAGYFGLGERRFWYINAGPRMEVVARVYRYPVLRLIYRPAGRVESLLRRRPIEISLAGEELDCLCEP